MHRAAEGAVNVLYNRIKVEPLTGALGAEILGVDLAQPLDDEMFADIHQAFLDHLVIFFRDQSLTPDQHKSVARRFGEPNGLHPQTVADIRAVEFSAEDWWWFYTAEVGAPRRSAGGL